MNHSSARRVIDTHGEDPRGNTLAYLTAIRSKRNGIDFDQCFKFNLPVVMI